MALKIKNKTRRVEIETTDFSPLLEREKEKKEFRRNETYKNDRE